MRMRGVVVGIIVCAGLAIAASQLSAAAKPQVKRIGRVGLGVGYQPPGFSGRDLSGATHSLDQAKGAVTVLHFWASWCPYCRTEIPELTQLHAQGDGVKVITVSVDEDLEGLKRFVAQQKLPYPVMADQELDPSVAEQYGVSGIPVTFIISADGYILQRINGAGEIADAVRVAQSG